MYVYEGVLSRVMIAQLSPNYYSIQYTVKILICFISFKFKKQEYAFQLLISTVSMSNEINTIITRMLRNDA